MSLSLALNSARSSLFATSTQIDASARNIANAGNSGASRKIAVTTTVASGEAQVVAVSRASDSALYARMIDATSSAAGSQARLDGLNRLKNGIGDTTGETSPAGRLGALGDALIQFANAPDDPALAVRTLTSAQDLATALSGAAKTVHTVRTDADAAMARSVDRVNDLLRQFGVENEAVITAPAGADVTDALDRRDSVLASLAEEIGVTAVTRGNADMVLYTDGGATLFETKPRAVSFQTSPILTAGQSGRAVMVDGVSVTGDDATMKLRSGRLAGLAELRDRTAPTFEKQLDAMALGLVESFAEADQSGAGLPAAAGLFTAGSAAVPTDATGLAARLAVNPAVDPAQGGSLTLLRDGGINGVAYVANSVGGASFSGHLVARGEALQAVRGFDAATNLPSPSTLADFAAASTGWLEGQRQTVAVRADSETALLSYASTALSNATGINMDEEYARQLDLERSYQASSKLIGVINGLYEALFRVVG